MMISEYTRTNEKNTERNRENTFTIASKHKEPKEEKKAYKKKTMVKYTKHQKVDKTVKYLKK